MRPTHLITAALLLSLWAREARAEDAGCIPIHAWTDVGLRRAVVSSPGSSDWKQAEKRVTRVLHEYAVGGLLVEVTQAQLAGLAPLGLHVVVQDEARFVELPAGFVDTFRARGIGFEPKPLPGWEPTAGARERVWWVAQAVGMPDTDWPIPMTAELEEQGIETPGWSGATLLFRATEARAKELARRDGVQWVGRYQPLYKLGVGLAEGGERCWILPGPRKEAEKVAAAAGTNADERQERVTVTVLLFPGTRLDGVKKLARAAGGKVIHENLEEPFLTLEVPRGALRALARHEGVRLIDPAGFPSLDSLRPGH